MSGVERTRRAHATPSCSLAAGSGHRGAGHDQVAEAGREPLDLRLDGLRHVHGRPGRDMAVGPEHMPSGWRATRIDDGRLNAEDERTVRVPTGGDVGLRAGDL